MPELRPALEPVTRVQSAENKSFFASFFSKKEDSSFSEEKEAKRLLSFWGGSKDTGPGRRVGS
jgi:hypothetical protein